MAIISRDTAALQLPSLTDTALQLKERLVDPGLPQDAETPLCWPRSLHANTSYAQSYGTWGWVLREIAAAGGRKCCCQALRAIVVHKWLGRMLDGCR